MKYSQQAVDACLTFHFEQGPNRLYIHLLSGDASMDFS